MFISAPRFFQILQRRVMPFAGALLLLGLFVVLAQKRNVEPVHVIGSVDRCIEPTAQSHFTYAALMDLLAQPYSEPDTACWKAVALPDVSAAVPLVDMDSSRSLQRAWFRLNDLPTVTDNAALVVHVPRVVGGTWQAWLNGQPLADNRDNWRMMWNDPIRLEIPAGLLHSPDGVDLRIAIAFHPELGYTFSRAYAGSPTALGTSIAWRDFLQQTVPKASSYVLLAGSAVFFLFWLARRQETTHLLLPLAGVAWAVCNLQYVLHRPDGDVLHDWYDALVTLSISWVMWLIYLFTLRLEAKTSRTLEYFLPAFVLFMTVIALPIWPRRLEFDILFQLCNLAMGLTVTGIIAVRAWQSARLDLKIICIALALAIACACHDIALYAQRVDPESIYLLPFSTTIVYGAMLYALVRRYIEAIGVAEGHSLELEKRLREQGRELESQHQRLRLVEKEQVLLRERERLMSDMHDGLGSSLMSTLVAVEQGRMGQGAVAEVLRSCIDDLRLVIDSLEPLSHDVELLLATLRHRLDERLQAAGLALQWNVGDLPRLAWLEAPHALQVMRIVQEVLTNIIKHARASRIVIDARHETGATHGVGAEGCAVISIADDGIGFDTARAYTGRGLKHLASRARALGADLQLTSAHDQGTTVTLRLPCRGDSPASK